MISLSLLSDGVEVVVKVFPKHDEKVQLGLYDKRLTGKNNDAREQLYTCISSGPGMHA